MNDNYSFMVPIRGDLFVPEELSVTNKAIILKRLSFNSKLERIISKTRLVWHLLESRLMLFVGGTFLYHKTKADVKNMTVLLKQIKIASANRSKIVGLGTGVDPITQDYTKSIAKEIVDSFDYIVFRDRYSLANAEYITGKTNICKNRILPV